MNALAREMAEELSEAVEHFRQELLRRVRAKVVSEFIGIEADPHAVPVVMAEPPPAKAKAVAVKALKIQPVKAGDPPRPPIRKIFARKITHCKRGHILSPENVYVTKEGWRQCLICREEVHRMKRNGTRRKESAR